MNSGPGNSVASLSLLRVATLAASD
jgi:hypothetical protein